MRDTAFTMAEALEIQKKDLLVWAGKLQTRPFEALHTFAMKSNEGVTDPYKVARGSKLTEFVLNWKSI